MGKLDGKVAIVTGAGRGLGRAYARRLAGLGAKIAVTDLNLKSYAEFEAEAKEMTADSTVDEINAGGGEAIGIEMEVRDRASVDAMVQKVFDTWGRVDILVANAGGGRGRPIDTRASTLDSDLLHLVTEMNYYGTVYCVNAVAPIIKDQHSGKIVTVASIAALDPRPTAATPLRRRSWQRSCLHAPISAGSSPIRHHCELHSPGTITTGRVVATVMPNQANANRDRTEQVALRRLGGVDDCAKVVEFLTTDLSDYVSGQCIAIDGGLVRSA
jgi:3-oxoacyl-[acyl-carrier protein] reductase